MTEYTGSDAILVVDDEPQFAKGLARLIQKGFPGNAVVIRDNAEAALTVLQERPVALMLTDLRMPGVDGFGLLDKALAQEPALTAVMLSGFGSAENAVRALKSGAYDFLTKPVDQDVLYRVVAKGLERAALMRENLRLRRAVGGTARQTLIGESPAMHRLREEIGAVAANDYSVLILGESGSGKELVAQNIHTLSKRGARTMVSINCTAVPDQMLESELFGHVKGAFTGAVKARQGLFLTADGSSLLLDEIGDMPVHLQPKILRALQEREVRPLGGSENLTVDVRILASTNKRLEARIASGEFREDLYFRLNVLTIHVPPLRERVRDVPLLAMHFLRQTCGELGKAELALSPAAMDYLASRPWPGNVRELQNFVRRLAVFCNGPVVTETQVRLMDSPGQASPAGSIGAETYKDAKERILDDFTRSYFHMLLEKTGGNVTHAARLSGLERVSLQKILKRFSIDAGEFRLKDE